MPSDSRKGRYRGLRRRSPERQMLLEGDIGGVEFSVSRRIPEKIARTVGIEAQVSTRFGLGLKLAGIWSFL